MHTAEHQLHDRISDGVAALNERFRRVLALLVAAVDRMEETGDREGVEMIVEGMKGVAP